MGVYSSLDMVVAEGTGDGCDAVKSVLLDGRYRYCSETANDAPATIVQRVFNGVATRPSRCSQEFQHALEVFSKTFPLRVRSAGA